MGAQGSRCARPAGWAAPKIARTERLSRGAGAPAHAAGDIDYATSTAKTTYGTIGIKVWIFKGEVIEDVSGRTYSTGA